MRGGTARARGGKNASYLARSRPTNTRCVETVVGMVCKWTEMYTVLSDTFGDILICVLRPARISRPRTCRAPSAERTPERGRHFDVRASPREARRASRVLLDLVFGRIFVMAIYGRRIPIRCHQRQDLVLYVPEVSCHVSITNEQTVVGQKLTSTPRELKNMLWDGLYSQRRLTWYQSLDFRTICGVMMITSAVMTTTLIIGK